jgi:hypothetical protein
MIKFGKLLTKFHMEEKKQKFKLKMDIEAM